MDGLSPSSRSVRAPGRPAWAIEWSRRSKGIGSAASPSFSSTIRTSSPPELNSGHHPSNFNIARQPSSRLSNHLSEGQQDSQTLSDDRAQQRALPINRRDLDDSKDSASRASLVNMSASGWGDDDRSKAHSGDIQPGGAIRGLPQFQPSRVYEELLKKESIREPVFGGRSKNQQLGSVAESWGAPPALEIPKGMFELEDDPPSPTEGTEMTPAELRAERARRAAMGIPAEKSGRPSIKDMEKERMEKLRQERLQVERARNNADTRDYRQDSEPASRRAQERTTSTELYQAEPRVQSGDDCVDDGW